MKTTAVRLYGKNDLRTESFELPPIKDDEILAKVVSDSICMSSYKAAIQGADHKRVPEDCAQNPTVIGHEFCGEIVEVGAKWTDKFFAGERFSIQPAHNKNGSQYAPGYSYTKCGGDATYVIIPPEIMEMNCLIKFDSDVFFLGSLSEPLSCAIGAFHASYHMQQGSYVHEMGIKQGGKMAVLAGVGPMGLAAINYAINNPDRHPGLMVVTDVDQSRLDRAASIYTVERAREQGIELHYLNTRDIDAVTVLRGMTGGTGYDDVFVFAPVKVVVEQGDAILGKDGCMNFFAGPADPNFTAEFNFYNVHYAATHICGTSGGNNDDLREALSLMERGLINPQAMITHVGGLDSAAATTLNLPKIPGGKKLVYTHICMPMTAINDFEEKGKADPLFAGLAEIVKRNNMLWCGEAEKYLLEHAKKID